MISSVPPPIGPRRRVADRPLELRVGPEQAEQPVLQLEVGALRERAWPSSPRAPRRRRRGSGAAPGRSARAPPRRGWRARRPRAGPAWPRPASRGTARSSAARIEPTAPSAITSRSHWKLAMISVEAAALLAEQVLVGARRRRRTPARRCRTRASRASSARLARTPSPRSSTRNEMPAVARLVAGAHGGDVEVRAHAVGDERLGAVDQPAAVDRAGAGAQRGDVRAGVRLGDRQRADPLAADRGREPALLLLRGAEAGDRRRGDRRCARRSPPPRRRSRSAPAPRRAPRRRPSPRPARTSARASRARRAGRRRRSGTSRAASHASRVRPQLGGHERPHLGPERPRGRR